MSKVIRTSGIKKRQVPELETRRLVLRPLELADVEATQRLFPHWEIVQYMGKVVPWPYPPDGALTFIRDVALPEVVRGDRWVWTLRLKTVPDEQIGLIDVRRDKTENRGFWIGIPWQNQGLMTEASEAVSDFWFNVLGENVLRVSKAVKNAASRRISEKGGMRIVATEMREYVSGPMMAEIWEITREEWEHRRLSGYC
jgi:ribosomal-protein-alanine N-acetyltransferase